MEQRVIINLGQGSWQSGFPTVIVQLWELESTVPMQLVGRLPAASGLASLYEQWQTYYRALNSNLGLRRSQESKAVIEIEEDDITHVSTVEFEKLCEKLKKQFNAWLSVSSFVNVEKEIHAHLDKSSPVQLIIESEDPVIRRFPWHLWNFLDNYYQGELAIGTLQYKRVPQIDRLERSKIRILSVLGDTTGIDVKQDRRILSQVNGAKTVVLDERPRAEINEALWDEQGWDVLCFSGHSFSNLDDNTGQIKINPVESLSITQLKHGLQAAIKKGLRLAIFNSCEGMGLAKELADLHIPYLIVMREPVPDPVAQKFLILFLQAFSAGISFPLAVKESRLRLQGMESTFPCASWLPVICQNPTARLLTWKSFSQNSEQGILGQQQIQATSVNPALRQPAINPKTKLSFQKVFWVSILVTLTLMGIRGLGLLEPLELRAYDNLMRMRPLEKQDENVLIVKATAEDLSKYGSDRLDDATLTKLVDELENYQPLAIGIDLYRAEPDGTEEERQKLIKKFQDNLNVFSICKSNASTPAYSAPQEFISGKLFGQLGFSNLAFDGTETNYTIRRHTLAYDPDSTDSSKECPSYSFSFTLAAHYLAKKDISPLGFEKSESGTTLRLGEMRFRKLSENIPGRFGGYQHLSGEDQIMLNFRQKDKHGKSFQSVTVEQVLEETIKPKHIQDKIALVGITSSDSSDIHNTPYGEMYGVEIHAHMISQLVEGARGERIPIWVLPSWHSLQWGDTLWIFGWSFFSGLVIWLLRNKFIMSLAIISFTGVMLYLLCFLLMIKGGWMPLIPSLLAILITSTVLGITKSSNLSK